MTADHNTTAAPLVFGALGDSITTAFNAAQPSDNLAHSWATGDAGDGQVPSHLHRLRRALPHCRVEPVNVAVAGARADALAGQVDRLVPRRPDYVTLLIGANDLHQWLFAGEYGILLERFATAVRAAVRRLIAANPRVLIVLAAVPDQSRVLDLALRHAGGGGLPGAFLAQLQPGMLDMLRRTYRVRWERVNDALDRIAADFPANVRFVAGTSRVRFDAEHLSPVDFYHPSVAGQRLLADVTWESGWFPA